MRAQAAVMSVMALVIFCLAYILYWTRRALDTLRGDVQRQISEVMDPIVYRVMDRIWSAMTTCTRKVWAFFDEKLLKQEAT